MGLPQFLVTRREGYVGLTPTSASNYNDREVKSMKKVMKEGRKYLFVNIDEPYAKAIFEVMKAGEIAKGKWVEGGISFKEWCKVSL